MTADIGYIDPEIVERIKNQAQQVSTLESVILDFTIMKPQGSSQVGECPQCGSKKLNFNAHKKIVKCFSCDRSAVEALGYLTKLQGKSYREALLYIAEKYQIELREAKREVKSLRKEKESFRDMQLRTSGISDSYQKIYLYENDTTQVQTDRYQAATIDRAWNIQPGDDMILHYIDLDGSMMKYITDRGQQKPLIRVRWSNPSNHLDKNGNEIKYQSPRGSGSHLWIPNWMIAAYKRHEEFDTLYISEGEKKADKLCISGLPAVGIMGIHNLSANGSMPHQLELIITRCKVKRVVFMLDADWKEISLKPGKPADARPYTFFRAVAKFHRYMYAFNNIGIDLRIFFGHHLEQMYKGIDDLIYYQFQGEDKERELVEDFERSMIDREGKGQYVQLYDITEMNSEYRLKEYFHLHSVKSFVDAHREKLKAVREFILQGIQRRYNPETDEFELSQPILPQEQYWKIETWEDRNGKPRQQITYLYENALTFLSNRGFGLYEFSPTNQRFIHIQDKVVHETTPQNIRRYVIDFTRDMEESEVLEVLHRGAKQYLGPDNLSSLPIRKLDFHHSQKEVMFLYFQNGYWEITADKIVAKPLSDLPKNVWEKSLIKFEPELMGPLADFSRRNNAWHVEWHDKALESNMVEFFMCTSDFNWRDNYQLQEQDGRKIWVQKNDASAYPMEEYQSMIHNMLCKMLATGYVAHDYRDYSMMKAIVAMDGVESEVGKSQGGTGKSIWGKMFQYLFPTAVIDGKKKNLEDDNFIYEGVDERTGAIVFDDVRVNFNFEFLFSQITTGVTVNKKGQPQFSVEPPKFIVITNHALNGDGNSFARRQYQISFSDFFNGYRTVADHFGMQLFYDWDYEQWNLFYNWIATCVQHYLRFGLSYGTQSEELHRRKLRQQMGETFLDWATVVFDTTRDEFGQPAGIFLNKKVNKLFLTERYLEMYPNDRKYVDARSIKQKLVWYCEYAGLEFNPTTNGERIKSNGKEYFIVADDKFDASAVRYNYIDAISDL
jgi:DNA primase